MRRPKSPPPPGPNPLDAHLGYWVRLVSNHVSSRFRTLLEAEGCSVTDWVALRTLFDRPQATHAELIQALGMTKGAVSKIVTRLEAKGLVQRLWGDGGARGQGLGLTPAGTRLVPRLATLADDNDTHCFGHLGAPERDALRAAFQALAAHHGLQAPPVD